MDPIWSFFIGFLSSGAVTIIGYIVNNIKNYDPRYSGVWEDEIFDDNKNIIKKDRLKLKYSKADDTIRGKGKRFFPLQNNEDNQKKWKISGVVRDGHIILAYWSDDKTIPSRGCIFVTLSDEPHVYTGKYYKQENKKLTGVVMNLIKCPRGTKY